jgi:hypothetical protein
LGRRRLLLPERSLLGFCVLVRHRRSCAITAGPGQAVASIQVRPFRGALVRLLEVDYDGAVTAQRQQRRRQRLADLQRAAPQVRKAARVVPDAIRPVVRRSTWLLLGLAQEDISVALRPDISIVVQQGRTSALRRRSVREMCRNNAAGRGLATPADNDCI